MGERSSGWPRFLVKTPQAGIDHYLSFVFMTYEYSDFEVVSTFQDFCTLKISFINREKDTFAGYEYDTSAVHRIIFPVAGRLHVQGVSD